MRFWTHLALVSLCLAAPAAAVGESIFNFENVASGTAGPLALSVNGLTANIGGSAAVCASTGLSGNMFLSLTGNALMQGFCTPATTGPLTVTFSGPLAKLSFALAINGTDPVPVTVTFLEHGKQVGSQTITPVVPDGSLSPEAVVTYTGTFNEVTIASAGLVAIDNLDAVPLPSSPTTPAP